MSDVIDQINNLFPYLHAQTEADLIFTSVDEMIRLYDERIKAIARTAGIFVAIDTSLTLSNGQVEYSLPSRHISPIRVAIPSGVLIPSTSLEIEALDDNFATTSGTPRRWYSDKIGAGKIRLHPVPNSGVAGQTLTIIYFEYPVELDCERSNRAIPTPESITDFFDLEVLSELYGQESDMQLPESAKQLKELSSLIREAIVCYYGSNQ